jgi:uncharacterized membrane protein
LCRLEDSSHQDDVTVDSRGFHDTEATPVLTDGVGRMHDRMGTGWQARGPSMAELIAIGYPEQATAQQARDEVSWLTRRPTTGRAIIRNGEGTIWVATNPYRLAVGIIWGMVLGLLVDLVAGTGVGVLVGAGLGAVIAKVDRSGIDRRFQGRVRAMLKPGTSTLVVLVDKETTDAVAEALSRHGGTILESSLSPDAEWRLQEALLGRTIS